MKIQLNKVDQDQFRILESSFYNLKAFLITPKSIKVKWTPKNLKFRSSMWTENGDPISLGFPKFFNWAECPDLRSIPSNLESVNIVEKIILSGNFNIIGHFDLIKKFGYRPGKDFKKVVEKLAGQLSGGDTAVEVNTAGLRNKVNEIYPSDEIIKILFNYNVPITLGSDSHNPEEIAYEFSHASERIRSAGYRSISGFSKRRRYDISI